MVSRLCNLRFSVLAVFWLAAVALPPAHAEGVVGKTILHPDGSKTESVSDPNTKELETKTFDANGVLTVRRLYQLNDRGQPVMGNVYDGAGNLQARSQSFFDAFNRLQEERLYNMAGECFQQVIHSYDSDGKAKKPQVINYQVKSPTMRPAVIDFTQQEPSGSAQTQQNYQPRQVPAQTAPTTPIVAPDPNASQSEPEQPKKSIWKRLFGGKKDD